MKPSMVKTSIVQVRVPPTIEKQLRQRADLEMITVAAYLRRMILRDLGLVPR
jgi:hypothetical protein